MVFYFDSLIYYDAALNQDENQQINEQEQVRAQIHLWTCVARNDTNEIPTLKY